jgi:hypothetical protein
MAPGRSKVLQLKIRGKSDRGISETGKTPLSGSGVLQLFWVQGNRIIVPSYNPGFIGIYAYPNGTKVKTIAGFSRPVAAAVSNAK